MTLAEALERVSEALSAREALSAVLSCYRQFHGYGEGIDGLTIDRYDQAAVIRYRADLESLVPGIAERVAAHGGVELVTARRRGVGADPKALFGDMPGGRVAVTEGPLSFLVDFSRAGNPGLYLDARPARDWLRQSSSNRRVLNLFAFTGSLGIAAAVGGATSVTHVDSHRATLDWARANCARNGVRTDDRDFARINIYQHLRKGQAGRQRYGGIVLDPPPGSSTPGHKDRTPGARGVEALAPLAARMLEPGGWLLCFFHHDDREHGEIDGPIARSCGLEVGWRGAAGADFPETSDRARLRMTALVR